jgi:hypothetical protein
LCVCRDHVVVARQQNIWKQLETTRVFRNKHGVSRKTGPTRPISHLIFWPTPFSIEMSWTCSTHELIISWQNKKKKEYGLASRFVAHLRKPVPQSCCFGCCVVFTLAARTCTIFWCVWFFSYSPSPLYVCQKESRGGETVGGFVGGGYTVWLFLHGWRFTTLRNTALLRGTGAALFWMAICHWRLARNKGKGNENRPSFFRRGVYGLVISKTHFLLLEITLPVFSKLTKMLKTRNVLGSDHNSQPHTHSCVLFSCPWAVWFLLTFDE